MSWGTPRRPKISTKIGTPSPREGGDGDIQVRGTKSGAKLFTKWAGRWFGTPELISSEEERQNVFTPKVWHTSVTTPSNQVSTPQLLVRLPEFITKANFLTATAAVKLVSVGGDGFWWLWRNGAEGTWDSTQNELYRYIMYMDWTSDPPRIDISGLGAKTASHTQDSVLELSVFFKG